MRAAGQSVQDANAQRSVRVMLVRGGLFMRNAIGVRMEMNMMIAIMFMLVRVDAESLPQRPKADDDEHYPHNTLAPGRDVIQRNHFAQPKRKQTYDGNARRMTNPPPHPRYLGTFRTADCKGRDGDEMVGPRPDVNHSGQEACENGDHSIWSRDCRR